MLLCKIRHEIPFKLDSWPEKYCKNGFTELAITV